MPDECNYAHFRTQKCAGFSPDITSIQHTLYSVSFMEITLQMITNFTNDHHCSLFHQFVYFTRQQCYQQTTIVTRCFAELPYYLDNGALPLNTLCHGSHLLQMMHQAVPGWGNVAPSCPWLSCKPSSISYHVQ